MTSVDKTLDEVARAVDILAHGAVAELSKITDYRPAGGYMPERECWRLVGNAIIQEILDHGFDIRDEYAGITFRNIIEPE